MGVSRAQVVLNERISKCFGLWLWVWVRVMGVGYGYGCVLWLWVWVMVMGVQILTLFPACPSYFALCNVAVILQSIEQLGKWLSV